MSIKLINSVSIRGRNYPASEIILGLGTGEEAALVQRGDAVQLSPGELPPGMSLSKREVDALTGITRAPLTLTQIKALLAGPAAAPSSPLTVWFSLQEGAGTTVKSNLDAVSATLTGTGPHWGPLPGLNFTGANYAQVNIASPQHVLRSILDLSTLTPDEQILVFCVLSHPGSAVASTGTLFGWGRSQGSSQGWGIKVNSNMAPQWHHRALGAGSLDSPQLQLSDPITGGNTRTALAIAIGRASNGDIEICSAMRMLDVPGPIQGINRTAVITPFAKPSGASQSAAWTSDCSLTIGGAPGNSPTDINNFMQAGTALVNLGIQRRPKSHRARVAALYSLSADMLVMPANLTV